MYKLSTVKARNENGFWHQPQNPESLIASAQAMVRNDSKWNPKSSKLNTIMRLYLRVGYHRRAGPSKINFDISFVDGRMEGAIAVVLRDEPGAMLDGFGKKEKGKRKTCFFGDSNGDDGSVGGTVALWAWTGNELYLETDCSVLTKALLSDSHVPWEVSVLVTDARSGIPWPIV